MDSANTAANLQSTFVVVKPDLLADTVPLTDSIWLDLDANYDNFRSHTLIASFAFADDWPTWEIHPHGDEIVSLIAGDVEMLLHLPDGNRSVRLTQPGEFVVVPKGVWHTAKVFEPSQMIFVTPGEETENREQPPPRFDD